MFKDLKVSEMLFEVTAAEYFTDFQPKRVVLGLGTWSLLTSLDLDCLHVQMYDS